MMRREERREEIRRLNLEKAKILALQTPAHEQKDILARIEDEITVNLLLIKAGERRRFWRNLGFFLFLMTVLVLFLIVLYM